MTENPPGPRSPIPGAARPSRAAAPRGRELQRWHPLRQTVVLRVGASRRTIPLRAALLVLALLALPASAQAIDALTAPAAQALTPSPVYVLPAPGVVAGLSRAELLAAGILVHDFVAPGERWGPGHRGVDLSAAAGSTVLAPQSGTVSFVGVVVDRPLLVLTHADGLRSTLEPVTTALAVGDRVLAGEAVAELAGEPSSHCSPAWCLHWGVRRGEEYLDPLALTRVVEPVVLLPMG